MERDGTVRLTIEMIPEDVEKGLPGNAWQCPIAEALIRLYPLRSGYEWYVGREQIMLCDRNNTPVCQYKMPKKAKQFIRAVDSAGEEERYVRIYGKALRPSSLSRPKPIRFVADLPEECVKGALA